jgi:hypothetical protein
MKKNPTMMTCCALIAVLVAGCDVDWGGCVEPCGGDDDTTEGKVSGVTLYNCTVGNEVGAPVKGRAYHVVARVSGGEWTSYGEINSSIGPVSPCDDDDAETIPQSLTIDFGASEAAWEVRAIKIARGDETCDSQTPEIAGACDYVPRTYQSHPEAPTAEEYLTFLDE